MKKPDRKSFDELASKISGYGNEDVKRHARDELFKQLSAAYDEIEYAQEEVRLSGVMVERHKSVADILVSEIVGLEVKVMRLEAARDAAKDDAAPLPEPPDSRPAVEE